MSLITIILLFVYTFGLGYTATAFVKNSTNFLERNLMRVGIGIGVFILLGVLLNLLHVPLDWKIFFILSLIVPVYDLLRYREKIRNSFKEIKITKSNIYILIVLVLFLCSFYMYHKGSFSYPYLENDDPWEHARGVKYVAEEKTVFEPSYSEKDLFRYIDPYPPGYEMVMGVLHQTNDSVSWTLKFFNALIIAMGLVFFYFFAMLFMGSSSKALFSTFILAAIPSYFTHFIWAHSLVIMLFFPAMYCLEKIKEDKNWMWVSMVAISSILLTQPTQALKLGVFLIIYFVVKSIYEKKFITEIFFAQVGGALLSLLWWGSNITKMFNTEAGSRVVNSAQGVSSSFISKILSLFPNSSGSATRAYTFNDFFVAKSFGMINVQTNIGIVVSILLLVSLLIILIKYKYFLSKKRDWVSITLVWFIFTFLGSNSMTFNLPVGLFAFRFWLLLAIPIALLLAISLDFFCNLGRKFKIPKMVIILLIVIGVLFTSGYHKYQHNSLPTWPPGQSWTSMEEVQLYLWVTKLPKNTKIMSFSEGNMLIGLDMFDCDWCIENIEFRKGFVNKTPYQTYNFLKGQGYEYFILDSMSLKTYNAQLGDDTQNIILEKFQEYTNLVDKYKIVFQNQGGVILKVV